MRPIFSVDDTPQASRLRLALIHLDGLALQWDLNYMRLKFDIYPSWTQYITNVTTCFRDVYENPLSNLVQIKQGGYVDDFELAFTQVNLIPEHALSIFLVGLEHSAQMHVRMFNPTSIAQASNLTRLYEATKPNKTPNCFTKPFTPYKNSSQPSSSSPPPTQTTNTTTKPLFS